MTEPKVNSFEYDNRRIITGCSTIDHSIRVSLKLTAQEYIICDCICEYRKNYNDAITYRFLLKKTGYAPDNILEIVKSLKERGILIGTSKQTVDVYPEWKIAHNSDDKFDILWKLHPKGNKADAKSRLPKVLKQVDFETLVSKLKAYIVFCQQSERFIKDLGTWLNPTKQHWNDALGIDNKPAEVKTTKLKFKT